MGVRVAGRNQVRSPLFSARLFLRCKSVDFEMAAGAAEDGDLGWGTAATERGIRARIEALLAVFGGIHRWASDGRMQFSESRGVKEPALGFGVCLRSALALTINADMAKNLAQG